MISQSSRQLPGVAGATELFGVQEIRVGVREGNSAQQLPSVVPTMPLPHPPRAEGSAGSAAAVALQQRVVEKDKAYL
ncbi:hypothetical protein GJAV_G00210360 [Gymnothorax javanicus]|nr:hypothetical protein GJAV_G00210360 [Gymnothorax javanicus]